MHAKPSATGSGKAERKRQATPAISVMAHGEPALWLTGGALMAALVMIIALLAFVGYRGFTAFWPVPVVKLETVDGRVLMGEVTRANNYQPAPSALERLPENLRAQAAAAIETRDGHARRRLMRTGNFKLTSEHFNWVSDYEVAPDSETLPEWAVVVERQAWGRFYGKPVAFKIDGEAVANGPAEAWRAYNRHHDEIRDRWEKRRNLEKKETGAVNYKMERERLKLARVELNHGKESAEYRDAQARFEKIKTELDARFAEIRARIDALKKQNKGYVMRMVTSSDQEVNLQLADIVRAYPANQLGLGGKIKLYLSRWGEFLTEEPREANSEGGVWPAIFGTAMMTLIMAVVVAPFGVLAALYLREYAKAGPLVSGVRIAINNLAGVPSIVFGVFGLGFFSYIVGGRIDALFYPEKLPSPTFGTGGILWASLTLALLTLPVVIVATEEALAAVPNSMREGSYACGASKWQTIKRIVMPRAMPGVMTGMILAMARGAGEVAPLMLVGAVKLAPELPLDGHFPYFHLERSFMHLGFHIYDLGFQSQNSEAAKPMVFATTVLLIGLILILNLVGIYVRGRLRKKFAGSAV